MWVAGSIIFLLLLLTLAMSFPRVQTFAARQAVQWANSSYGTDMSIERLRYVFPDRIILHKVHVQDEQQDTLIYAERMDAGVDAFVANTAYSSGVSIDGLRFYYLKKEGEEEYNFLKFVWKFSTGDTTQKKPFGLQIADIEINDGRFRYEDLNCDSCTRFFISDIYTEIADFELSGNEVAGDIESLTAKDRYSLNLRSFSSHVEYKKEHFSFTGAEFETDGSYFKGDVSMRYASPSDLSHFVERVTLVADVESSDLASEEIMFFAPAFPDFRNFSFSGKVNGLVDDLYGEDLDVQFASTTFTGDLNIKNSMHYDSLFVDASDVELHTDVEDARYVYGLFSDSALPKEIDPLGGVSLHGDFAGSLNDFETDVVVRTDLGTLRADLHLNIPEDPSLVHYHGDLAVQAFDVGTLLGENSLGRLSTSLSVDGTGLDPVTMNTQLRGEVSAIEYNNYRYRNIDIDGRVRESRFNGSLLVDDPNLQFRFDGSAGFGPDTSTYNFTAAIRKAELYNLNFSKDSISTLTATLNINLRALNYELWEGDVRITNLTYENSRNFHFFEDILVHAEGLEGERYLEVDSRIVTAKLRGNYTLEGMWQAARSHVFKFIKSREQVSPPNNEEFTFDIAINNTRVLTEIFVPKLEIEAGSRLIGSYSSTSNVFKVDVNSPGFKYDDNRISDIQLEYEGGADISELAFNVGRYVLPNGLRVDSIILDNYYSNDTLNYDLNWVMRDSIDSRGSLHGYAVQYDTNSVEMSLYESGFNIGQEDIVIRENNRIRIDTSGFSFENLIIANQGRTLTINGNVSDNPNEILRVNLRGFGVDLVNYFTGSSSVFFDGELYGDVIFTQLLGQPKFAADFKVDSLEMNSVLLGELQVSSDWSVENDTIQLNSSLTLGELTTFAGHGFYQPDSLGSIFFDIDFDRFRLVALNPLLEGLAENLRGYLSGEVKVRGNTGAPEVTGEVTLPNTAFTISFLQTDYNVVGEPVVRLLKDRIAFPDMTLRDTRYGTEGTLRGDITHTNFRDFNLGLSIDANELLVLNTTARSEDPYYGTAFVSGNIALRGPIDDLSLSADLSTRRNTRFYIPISGATEVRKSDFVTFVNPNAGDSIAAQVENRLNLDKGISLDFNLNINPNAKLGIIIDEDGNQMEATGSGNIRVLIEPYSDLEIYGTYTVAEGSYNFAIENAAVSRVLSVKREFDILRGGTVTWNGDPFGALINLTARYNTRADPGALVAAYNGGQTLVYVDLLISGELMNPEINFDIAAPRAPGNVQSVLASRFTDMDARYEQVFSLLILGRFMDDQGMLPSENNTQNMGLQNMGLKVLAGQAETYLNQFTGDYNVTLDYQGSGRAQDDPTEIPIYQEEVEVGLSKDFFDDRVTVNGVVGVPVGQNNTQNQIAGDFEVEYDITPDGRFRAKAFNRSVQQYYSFGQQNYQQGVGIFYRMDFENWGDFINKIFDRNKDAVREEEEEQSQEENKGTEELPDEREEMSKGK